MGNKMESSIFVSVLIKGVFRHNKKVARFYCRYCRLNWIMESRDILERLEVNFKVPRAYMLRGAGVENKKQPPPLPV